MYRKKIIVLSSIQNPLYQILYKNNNIVLDMNQQSPYYRYNRTASSQSFPIVNNSTTTLKNQVDSYPNAANAQKIDTLKHLFQTIETQAVRINQLEMEQRSFRVQSQHAQSQRNIAAKFDEVIQRRNQATENLINDLKCQNQSLQARINSLQSQKQNVKTQIKLPSFLEKFNIELKNKLASEAEVDKLKLFNEALGGQKDKLSKQLRDIKQQYDRFCKTHKKEYQDLNSRYSAEAKSRSDMEREVLRLNDTEKKLLEDVRKARKQLEESQSRSQLYFKYTQEILGLITVFEAPEKWTNFVNSLKSEDLSQESKRGKIKQVVKENNKKLIEGKARLQKAEDSRGSLQKQNQNLSVTLSQRVGQLQLASKRVSQLEGKLKQEATLRQTFSKQKDELGRLKLKLEQDIRVLNENVRKLTSAVSSLQKEKTDNNLTISSLQSKIVELQKSKQSLEKISQKQASDIKLLSSKNSSLEAKVKQLTVENQRLNEKIKKLEKQLQEKKSQIERLQLKINELERELEDKQSVIRKLNSEKDELNHTINDKQKNIKGLKDGNQILKKKNDDLGNNLSIVSKQLSETKYKAAGYEKVISKVNTQLIGSASHYYLGQGLNLRAVTFEKLNELDNQINTILSSWRDSYNRAKFFNGSAIVTRQNVAFIIESLDEYMGCTPFESKLVYKYDPLNQVNFHSYFDRVQNLIAFIRLTNGTVIGGFTVYPVDPDRIQRPGKGFLFSVTGKKVYHIRSDPKLPVVSYDNYYFIFGNAEIRLKSQEKKVFSNFGIANSTFDNGSDPRTKFLNVLEMTNNELDIDTYEFYRISFKA